MAIVHTAAMLVVAGALAWIFLRFFGVALLGRIWLNVDAFWAIAPIAARAIAMI